MSRPLMEAERLRRAWARHPDRVAAVGLVLLPFVLLGRALVPGRVLSPADILVTAYPWKSLAPGVEPQNRLLTDIASMFHPWLVYAGRELAQGRVPLWDPHAFTGAPFFANPQTALLFPLTWLAIVLPATLAVTLGSILKLSVAGLAMYWLLRVLAVACLPALLGALAYMLSGVVVVWLHWSLGNALSVLPLLFGAAERVGQRGGARPVATLAAATALLVFAGYPQIVALGLLGAGVWILGRAVAAADRWRLLVRAGGGLALGVALAAVQLLPFLEYLGESAVMAYRAEWMRLYALPLYSAVTLLLPWYFGSPVGGDWWGYGNFNELTTSPGLLPWLALPLALGLAWRRLETRVFAGAAALALVMVYGLPPAGWLAGLPPFSMVINTRMACVLAFALCVVLGVGLDALRAGTSQRGPRLVRVTFVLLTAALLATVANQAAMIAGTPMRTSVFLQYAGWLLLLTAAALALVRLAGGGDGRWWIVLLGVQLAASVPLAAVYNPVIPARLFYPATPALEHLRAATGRDLGRVALPGSEFAPANVAALFGLYEASGYDGLTPRRIEPLVDTRGPMGWSASDPLRLTAPPSSPSFDLLGIRRVLTPPGAPRPAAHFAAEYEGPDGQVWRNERALPRAFVVFRAQRCQSEAAVLERVLRGDLDSREEVLLDACDEAPATAAGGGQREATIQDYRPERVVIETVTDAAGYLVLTDTWFPGWRATVDETPARIWRADHAFRAVWIPAGRHRVVLEYAPASVTIGLVVSLAAGGLALYLGVGRRHA